MLVGQSVSIDRLRLRIERVAATTFTVLVEGESGVGKELVARQIHARSSRRRGPFVPVNCAALVESLLEAELFGIEERTATGVRGRRGKFEVADGGTLFLDEVGDLSPTAQAKLLRVLQDMTVERVGAHGGRRVDTRVVVATNRHLREMVNAGRFREDLYYRLAGVEIVVPPLRRRREDIPLLVDHFMEQLGCLGRLRMGTDAVAALSAYAWPGNVRQLARVIERVAALSIGPEIGMSDLPDEIRQGCGDAPGLETGEDGLGEMTLRAWGGHYVRLVLKRCEGNKRRACDILDISYHTLMSYLDEDATPQGQSRRPGPVACDAGS